ncbi:TetR/AcrR family transcriptional regulator [Kribbella sindirgiensis]|uniref:TetR/AcrR family transcriptional regulator n=1 Tax=Kribbella sindirgiensis TaxID=1124744 RepID=A0A4R0IH22_9ACTN|nr:TetR/AcrR family transcriptional regulator [Kribbella sindirgiensis]TCC30506.1 TetR/AcrR family transcriptional regulator [Kribbella sindirgiensis]
MATDQRRRRADAERNADTVLSATRDLLVGGTVPTMSEVASAAGITRMTLYAHFATRELLVEAVVRRAIAETDDALTALELDTFDVDEALDRLVRTSWPILDRYRKVRVAAVDVLGPAALREQHDAAFRHVEQLIARGQQDGIFRVDLAHDWLVATFYAVLHAAADEVDAGRLRSEAAPPTLVSTLRSLLHTR